VFDFCEEGTMATLTIRDLDDEIRDKLRVRAAQKGVSMEAEVRAILADAVKGEPAVAVWTGGRRAAGVTDETAHEPQSEGWVERMRQRLAETNGFWEDDFVEFVNNIRKLPPGTTYEEFVANRERFIAEIERARWS
jgi:plasmid stability protein